MLLTSGPGMAALLTLPGIGLAKAARLAQHYDTWQALTEADPTQIHQLVKVHLAVPATPPAADGPARPVSLHDADYPARLSRLPEPPPLLWVRGTLPPPDRAAVAIVGTRQPDQFGLHAAALAAQEATQRGVAVVSGLALGIDSAAHHAAAEAGAPSWAVLGQGLDTLPTRGDRAQAAARILADGGGLICEVPPTTPLAPRLLFARNRIVTGLTDATLVAATSLPGPERPAGTLHAARHALAQGRLVAAMVPPTARPGYEGNLDLIATGAARPIRSRDELAALLNSLNPDVVAQ